MTVERPRGGQRHAEGRTATDAGPKLDAATEAGFSVDKKQIALAAPIKELGLHVVHVVLHPEVDVEITLNVARSTEEAELQASGKSIQELAAEEEAAAEFEIAELFDDIGAAQLDELEDAPAEVASEQSEGEDTDAEAESDDEDQS